MSTSVAESRKWPTRLKELSEELESTRDEPSREGIIAETWKILYFAFSICLRSHAGRMGGVSREDIEDLAAEKSLDSVRRIVSGKTGFTSRRPPEIASYVSKVAKNALLDLIREHGRRVEPKDEDRPEWDFGATGEGTTMSTTDPPDIQVERKEFAGALRRCAEKLDPRSRLIWFFRVFYGMASKDIAVHPKINLKPGHVDVLLQRTRQAISECMNKQGYGPQDMPPGTFVELWKVFRLEKA